MPGDTHRNLQVEADYSGQTFKHILVPIWLLTYDYGARNFQVVINGYTGPIAGKYPKSWVKITLAVLAGLAAAGLAGPPPVSTALRIGTVRAQANLPQSLSKRGHPFVER